MDLRERRMLCDMELIFLTLGGQEIELIAGSKSEDPPGRSRLTTMPSQSVTSTPQRSGLRTSGQRPSSPRIHISGATCAAASSKDLTERRWSFSSGENRTLVRPTIYKALMRGHQLAPNTRLRSLLPSRSRKRTADAWFKLLQKRREAGAVPVVFPEQARKARRARPHLRVGQARVRSR